MENCPASRVREAVPDEVTCGSDQNGGRGQPDASIGRPKRCSDAGRQQSKACGPYDPPVSKPTEEAHWKTEGHQTQRGVPKPPSRREPKEILEVRPQRAKNEGVERQPWQDSTEWPCGSSVSGCYRH